MKVRLLALAIVAFSPPWGVTNATTNSNSRVCDTWPTNSSDLLKVLGQRVVDAASRAASASENNQKRLDEFVASNAEFDLGAGDVGRPLGRGSSGLRRLMSELQADSYRFDGWDYMSREERPCDVHEVTVEFSSRKLAHRADVKFKFSDGRIVEGKGWLRSMITGVFPVDPVNP
jgi:hypothetical protein